VHLDFNFKLYLGMQFTVVKVIVFDMVIKIIKFIIITIIKQLFIIITIIMQLFIIITIIMQFLYSFIIELRLF